METAGDDTEEKKLSKRHTEEGTVKIIQEVNKRDRNADFTQGSMHTEEYHSTDYDTGTGYGDR